MKIVISLACIIAVASAIPRPGVDEVEVVPNYIPQEFRRDADTQEIPSGAGADENLDDSYVPETILINYVDIDPSQPDMNDLIEFVKDASRVLEINPEVFQISNFPINEDEFQMEPVQIVNSLPVDLKDAEKVSVVNSPSEINSVDENAQVDAVQIVNTLPKDDAIVEKSNDEEEIVKQPINDEQNEVIQVASIPNTVVKSPSDEEIRVVKFVENPNVDGSDNFAAVPLAPSELDSLRVNFEEETQEMPVNTDDKFSFYPVRLYPDPFLR